MNHSTQAYPLPEPLWEGVDPFVRQTYRIFAIHLAIIVGLGFASYYLLPASALGPLGVADSLIWVLCGWFGWRHPIALTSGLFTAITGLFLGQLAHYYPSTFAMASVLTLLAFVGLSLYVHVTKKDFSFLRGFLYAAFFIILGCGLLFAFIGNHWLNLGLAAFGTVTFVAWILYDTSQILENTVDEMTPAVAALELMLDIVGLHRWLLDLVNNED